MALFLQDILTVLHKVSLKFQKHGSIVAEVSLCINTAIKTLPRFSNTDGPFLKKLPKFETFSAPSAGATTRQIYKLTCGSGILATERNVLVEALCTALECRFDDTSVVKVTAITDFKMWPTSEEELHTFGNDWMNTLLDQFGSYLDDKDDQVLGLHSACIHVLCMLKVWTSELWCGRVTFLNHSSTIRVPRNP